MNQNQLIELLRCPKCQGSLKLAEKSNLCVNCGTNYSFNHNGQARFIEKDLYDDIEEYEHILSVEKYWDAGWKKRSEEHNYFHNYSSQELQENAKKQIKNINSKIDFEAINKKIGVNIGSGTGAEASYLMTLGNANIIGIDVTAEATRTTQQTIDKLGVGKAIQADARYLPIANNSIDFVYSSGVLHHSRNIRQSIDEIYRILKPNGVAYIGLYSKTSIYFQSINLRAIFSGSFSKEKIYNKLSSNTENSWRTEGSRNPHTRIFGASDCKKLFHKFDSVSISRGAITLPDRGFYKRLKFLEKSKMLTFFGDGIYTKAIK